MNRRAQRGYLLSLLLSLLALGVLMVLLLRGTGNTGRLTEGAKGVSCEPVMAKLVADTGGQGPKYRAGYEALPQACRALLPAPQVLEPRPASAEPDS